VKIKPSDSKGEKGHPTICKAESSPSVKEKKDYRRRGKGKKGNVEQSKPRLRAYKYSAIRAVGAISGNTSKG